MRSFLIALQFLTRLPVRLSAAPSREETARSTRAYPLVGLLIGLFLAAVHLLLGRQTALGAFFIGAFLVVLEAAITGGLHLDGLMDAADGLLGCWSRERALAIMKDSRVGANGVLAACGLLLLKTGAAASLRTPAQALVLTVMPCYGRWTALLMAATHPYGGETDGLGRAVVGAVGLGELAIGFVTCLGVTVGVALAAGSAWAGSRRFVPGLALFCGLWLAGTLAGAVVAGAVRRRIGGITGDVIGAAVELSELVVLVAGVVCWP